jgi:hypothetical protein
LHIASQHGHLDVVQLLVNAGIEIGIWNDPIEPGVEKGSWKPHVSLSKKVRQSLFISVSKADVDAILEQVPVPGDGPLVAE